MPRLKVYLRVVVMLGLIVYCCFDIHHNLRFYDDEHAYFPSYIPENARRHSQRESPAARILSCLFIATLHQDLLIFHSCWEHLKNETEFEHPV